MNTLVPSLSVNMWTLVGACVVWPLTVFLKAMKEMIVVSMFGLTTTAVLSFAVVVNGGMVMHQSGMAVTSLSNSFTSVAFVT